MRKILVLVATLILMPSVSQAHGIGQVYALPVPLKYYLGGAGVTVAFSFFVIAIFLSKEHEIESGERLNEREISFLADLLKVLRVLSVSILIITIATGIFGSSNPTKNFAPLFFWVYFLIGMQILSVFIGNIWDKINPWKIIANWASSDLKITQHRISPLIGPVLLLALFWFELASSRSFIPAYIGISLATYTLINLMGSIWFSNWFEDGELFTRLFSFVGLLAPYKISDNNRTIVRVKNSEKLSGRSFPKAILIISSIMLAGASFDSLKESVLWFKWISFFHIPVTSSYFYNSIGIILAPLPFIFSYLGTIWIIKKITGYFSAKDLALRFTPSLIPIAFGYTLAHNFSLFVVSAKQMLGILSDPFGFGWNIFGTISLATGSIVLGAKAIWFIEIGFVVLAHIFGVWYAHVLALNIFKNSKSAMKSQYPMMILMVVYTIPTLWLLSQPLVASK